jgi:hypothetical protein
VSASRSVHHRAFAFGTHFLSSRLLYFSGCFEGFLYTRIMHCWKVVPHSPCLPRRMSGQPLQSVRHGCFCRTATTGLPGSSRERSLLTCKGTATRTRLLAGPAVPGKTRENSDNRLSATPRVGESGNCQPGMCPRCVSVHCSFDFTDQG